MFAGIADGLINAALIPEMTGASDLKLQALKAALSSRRFLSLALHLPLFFGQSPSPGLECLSDELELPAGLSAWPHSLAFCLATFRCPLMVSVSLYCCKRYGQLPWACRCFAPTATLLSLQQTRFECEPLSDPLPVV